VLVPADNKKDTSDIPTEIRKNIKLRYYSDVLKAVKYAL
jgi:ATP-dependent Lon protease